VFLVSPDMKKHVQNATEKLAQNAKETTISSMAIVLNVFRKKELRNVMTLGSRSASQATI